ncbi:MAG: energy transducer TonB [Chitinophagaceae bacterium]
MKAHQILQAELIDILFENKNKMYGAYELRKNYANRLWLSLTITALVCVLAIAVQHIIAGNQKHLKTIIETTDFIIAESPIIQDKPKDIIPPSKPLEKLKMIKMADIIIVKDKDFIEKDIVPPIDEAEKSLIGLTNRDGNEIKEGYIEKPTEIGTGLNTTEEAENKPNEFTAVQMEAEFAGGITAWTKFLERNLNSDVPANNGAPMGKYTVMVVFRVEANGTISNLFVENDPGFGIAEEAMRVIKRAPIWKPANQNGRLVASTKKQAITFLVNEAEN